MNTAKTITVVDEGQEIALNKDFEDRLVAGGLIYYCDECKVYHIDPEHDWKSLAQALHTIQTDIAALPQPPKRH